MEAPCIPGVIPAPQIPQIAAGDDDVIKGKRVLVDVPAEQGMSSCTTSTSGYCSDHSDCDSWGPSAFEEKGALEEMLADPAVRQLSPGYDMQELCANLLPTAVMPIPFTSWTCRR